MGVEQYAYGKGHHIPVPRGRERENIEQKEGQE